MLFQSSNSFIESTLFSQTVFAGFGTKQTGDGRKKEVIDSIVKTRNNIRIQVVDPQQVHGDTIGVITKETNISSEIPQTDGLITKERDLLLTVVTADCVPVIYVDPARGIVGISHQGWKGTELNVAKKMVARFEQLGSNVKDVLVAIGPSINQCCYPRNLLHENFDQLIDAGVLREHIDWFPFCTKCDKDRFYSYRRERKENFEEQVSFVMLNN